MTLTSMIYSVDSTHYELEHNKFGFSFTTIVNVRACIQIVGRFRNAPGLLHDRSGPADQSAPLTVRRTSTGSYSNRDPSNVSPTAASLRVIFRWALRVVRVSSVNPNIELRVSTRDVAVQWVIQTDRRLQVHRRTANLLHTKVTLDSKV